MDQKMLSEEDLDRLLIRASRTRPVNRAALDDEGVGAALDNVWRRIEWSARWAAPSHSASRTLVRRRWATAGIAAAAAGVASLVGIAGLTGRTDSSSGPLAVSQAAAATLHRFAHAAAGQPAPTAGQWEYVESDTLTRGSVPAGNTTVSYTSKLRTQSWYAPDGRTRERVTNDGGSFATPQDQANYEANKSAVDKRFGGTDPLAATGVTADVVDPNQNGPRQDWQTSPPSDPQTLLSEISASEPASLHSDPAYLWGALTHVLFTSTSAQAHSTAFAALAYVPGTKVLGKRTDPLGRSGTAISFTDSNPRDAGNISTIVVSPSTGAVLEDYETLRVANHAFPAGTVVSRETFVQQGVVGSDTALPGGGTQALPASAATSASGFTPTTPSTSTPPQTNTASR